MKHVSMCLFARGSRGAESRRKLVLHERTHENAFVCSSSVHSTIFPVLHRLFMPMDHCSRLFWSKITFTLPRLVSAAGNISTTTKHHGKKRGRALLGILKFNKTKTRDLGLFSSVRGRFSIWWGLIYFFSAFASHTMARMPFAVGANNLGKIFISATSGRDFMTRI